jgi:SAM-dependent methyltransferase
MRKEAFAQSYDPTVVDRFGVWLSARQIRRFVPELGGKRVGDFGCGYHATFMRSVVDEIGEGVLADVAIADDLKANPKLRVLEGDVLGSLRSLQNESLDVAMCVSVLEHLWEPQAALREMFRVLAPGGTCLVNVPSWWGKTFLELSAFKLGMSPADEMNDHKMYYDARDLWPMLVAAGFTPQRIRCFSHKFGLNTFAACVK